MEKTWDLGFNTERGQRSSQDDATDKSCKAAVRQAQQEREARGVSPGTKRCDKLPDVLDHTRRVTDNVLDNRVYVRAKYMENQRRK